MGYIDMPLTNQNEEESVNFPRKGIDFMVERFHNEATNGKPVKQKSIAIENGMTNSLWSSDGLIKQSRHSERPSSTPPTHFDNFHLPGHKDTTSSFALSRFALRESVEDNNQDDEVIGFGRHDRLATVGRNLQRSWSAPPIPDNVRSSLEKIWICSQCICISG